MGKVPWHGKWHLTPVFLPVKSQGQRSLAWSMRLQSQRPPRDRHLDSSSSAASLQPATQWLRASWTGISLHSPAIKAPASKLLWSLPFPRKSFICSLLTLIPGVGKIPWRRDRLPTPVFLGFPGGSAGKESAYNSGDLGLISGLGQSLGEGNGYPFYYSLKNSMDCISMGSQRVGLD